MKCLCDIRFVQWHQFDLYVMALFSSGCGLTPQVDSASTWCLESVHTVAR